jgi:hypothetical protein
MDEFDDDNGEFSDFGCSPDKNDKFLDSDIQELDFHKHAEKKQ